MRKVDGPPQGDESLGTELRPTTCHLQDPFSTGLVSFWGMHLLLYTPFLPLKQKVTASQPSPLPASLGAAEEQPGAVYLRLGCLPGTQVICHLLTFLPSGLLWQTLALRGLTPNVEPGGKDRGSGGSEGRSPVVCSPLDKISVSQTAPTLAPCTAVCHVVLYHLDGNFLPF